MGIFPIKGDTAIDLFLAIFKAFRISLIARIGPILDIGFPGAKTTKSAFFIEDNASLLAFALLIPSYHIFLTAKLPVYLTQNS